MAGKLSCAGAEGRPAPWTRAHRLGVSRRQPQNEDLSDCAEGCVQASVPSSPLYPAFSEAGPSGRGRQA